MFGIVGLLSDSYPLPFFFILFSHLRGKKETLYLQTDINSIYGVFINDLHLRQKDSKLFYTFLVSGGYFHLPLYA